MRTLSRRRVLQGAAAVGAASVASVAWPGALGELARSLDQITAPNDLAGTRTWASLGKGSGPGQVGIIDQDGMMPDGPKAICARANGDIAVLDTLNTRILLLAKGTVRVSVDLPGAIYPIDLEESQGKLWALDHASLQVFEIDGTTVRAHPLPKASRDRATRLAADPLGVSVVEDDYYSYPLAFGRGALREGIPGPNSGVVNFIYPRMDLARKSATVVLPNSSRVTIPTPYWLGSVISMGADALGRNYVLVTQLTRGLDLALNVVLTMHRFNPDGSAAGIARVPVRGRRSQPSRPVTFSPSGDAFALFPQATGALVLRLDWSTGFGPIQIAHRPVESIALAANPIYVTRSSAQYTGTAFENHQWYCSLANYGPDTGDCRVRPSYITGAYNYYYELPYSWGGFDSISQFDSKMSAGNRAGNAQGAYDTCGATPGGLDCSGFVSRNWGLTSHVIDYGLLDWCTNVADIDPNNPPPWMSIGDAYDWYNHHIRQHDGYATGNTGAAVLESSSANGWRVYRTTWSWLSMDSYTWDIGNFVNG
jgi:hypothetical protein